MSAVQRERRSQAPYCSRYASAAALISGVTYGVPSAFWMRWPASKISFTLAMANREAEFGFDGLHRGRVGILGLLHAVHAQYQADDLDVRLGLELRDDLAHSGAGGHHVVDEQDLHAVRKLRADHHAAVAMVLLLLAVEGVADPSMPWADVSAMAVDTPSGMPL